MEKNKYIQIFLDYYIKAFRRYNKSVFSIDIKGLGNFISRNDTELSTLLEAMKQQGFEIHFSKDNDTIELLQITVTDAKTGKENQINCNIDNLLSIVELSSQTNISTIGIIITKIISKVICQIKILYKAIVLDLDDTVWNGTLAEIGIQAIKHNLHSKEGMAHIRFMNFVRALAEEFGIYVAICSKNSQEMVEKAIESFDEKIFPLKGQIDCIMANFNDKSQNIRSIAKQLSIMPDSIVFIDDNPIIRDEVRKNLPNLFIPEWSNHDELIIQLIFSCVFDRFELSIKSRNKRKQFKILQQERLTSSLPTLYVTVKSDLNHKEASKLYAKSNQFKFNSNPIQYIGNAHSILFEIFRENGENLGICSTLTYALTEQALIIYNWAISCRYFEIGLEEFILQYIITLSAGKDIYFAFQKTGTNQRVLDLLEKYHNTFCEKEKDKLSFIVNKETYKELDKNTNLKEK